MSTAGHPLDPLTADEIRRAVAVIRAHRGLGGHRHPAFAYVGLAEPTPAQVRAARAGVDVERRARALLVTGPEARVVDAEVLLGATEGSSDRIGAWRVHEDARPPLLMEETVRAIECVRADPRWRRALAGRGITEVEEVQIDPWPAGAFGFDHEAGRRICRCLSYVREHPGDNGYARPIEGLMVVVDMGRGAVLEVFDTGAVPLPPGPGSYLPEDVGPLRPDLRPLEITQREGPSFTVTGGLVRWQRWTLRVGLDAIEGLILRDVAYHDGGRRRPILSRAAVDEMVVPYGDPSAMHGWKSAFDVGEWGLGRMANGLAPGCDCLGEIHYFDAVLADERGDPYTLPRAICMHEEDVGILWKHVDLRTGRAEVRRSRRLVVSSIATVGNYDYGFYWYFYLDGSIQLEVKLTGILSPMTVAPGARPRCAPVVGPGIAAPFHQHLFNVRLDMDVDGGPCALEEVEARPLPAGPENPWGSAFEAAVSPIPSEDRSARRADPAVSRRWRVVNRARTNRWGDPVAYDLVPGPTPTLLADPTSSIGRRAGFAAANLWATPFEATERRAAGDFPNQHAGGAGLPAWTTAGRSLEECDLVLWYTFGTTHLPRPEEWPVMPVESVGFSLQPVGFFDTNPALDVPPPDHCAAGTAGDEA